MYFPDQFKTARVVPIFESSDPLLLNIYRPFSILLVFSKTFEKNIYAFISRIRKPHVSNSLVDQWVVDWHLQLNNLSVSMRVLIQIRAVAVSVTQGGNWYVHVIRLSCGSIRKKVCSFGYNFQGWLCFFWRKLWTWE